MATPGARHRSTDQIDDEYAEKETHQANVQPHVAIQDVAEFVTDDALQLVSR